MARFRPPKVTDPPQHVEIEWVDAQHESHDGPSSEAGGLALLPCAGYHVRTAPSGPNGPFVVISMEHDYDENKVPTSRFRLSIPTAWITSWSVVSAVKVLHGTPQRTAVHPRVLRTGAKRGRIARPSRPPQRKRVRLRAQRGKAR